MAVSTTYERILPAPPRYRLILLKSFIGKSSNQHRNFPVGMAKHWAADIWVNLFDTMAYAISNGNMEISVAFRLSIWIWNWRWNKQDISPLGEEGERSGNYVLNVSAIQFISISLHRWLSTWMRSNNWLYDGNAVDVVIHAQFRLSITLQLIEKNKQLSFTPSTSVWMWQ